MVKRLIGLGLYFLQEFQLTCQRTDLVRQELRKLYGIITGDRDISDPLEAVEPMDTAEGPIV